MYSFLFSLCLFHFRFVFSYRERGPVHSETPLDSTTVVFLVCTHNRSSHVPVAKCWWNVDCAWAAQSDAQTTPPAEPAPLPGALLALVQDNGGRSGLYCPQFHVRIGVTRQRHVTKGIFLSGRHRCGCKHILASLGIRWWAVTLMYKCGRTGTNFQRQTLLLIFATEPHATCLTIPKGVA